MMKRYIYLFILILLLSGCKKVINVTKHDNDRYTTELKGKTRTFYIKLPEDYSSNKSYSLMFYLHGAGQTAFEVSDDGFTDIAHDSDYLIVYPGAVLGSWKLYDSSDIDFIEKLINYMNKHYTITKDRVFVAGFSLGGFMAIKLGFEMPKKISGVSVLSGSIFPEHLPEKQSPLAVQHIHALDDNGILYNGTKGQVLSIPQSIDFWKKVNNSDNNIISHSSNGVKIERWNSNSTQCSVELITYDKGGHQLLPNSPTYVIDFFNRVK